MSSQNVNARLDMRAAVVALWMRAGFCAVLWLRTGTHLGKMPMCSTLDIHTESTCNDTGSSDTMVDATEPPRGLVQAVEQHGQQHLLASWQNLSTAQRQELAATLEVS